MQSDTIDGYAKRVARVVGFVESSIEAGRIPNLSEMAGVAALSEYHFHRVFRLMAGETPAEAVSRIRLAASLRHLEAGNAAGAVAASGYSTSQAFARAMKERVGVSPKQMRTDKTLLAKSKSSLAVPMAPVSTGSAPLTVEIAALNPIRLLARRNEGDFAALNAGYTALFEALCEQVDPSSIRGIYGIPRDDPRFVPAERCRFDCAFDVGEAGCAREELVVIEIAAGRYAGLRHIGDHDDIHARVDDLYQWVVERGHRIADRPLFIHYLDDPDEVPPPEQKAIIWLPLEDP